MWNLKYVALQAAIFGIAVASYAWCGELGICNRLGIVVVGCLLAYAVTLLSYRRSMLKRHKQELEDLERRAQPWEER